MDLLITGATGFVGSHLALRWLLRNPAARIGCVVRAADAATGLLRLRAALSRAAADEGALADVPCPGSMPCRGIWMTQPGLTGRKPGCGVRRS